MQEKLRDLSEDENNKRWLFVTEEEIKTLPCFEDDTLIAIKAPHGTMLKVPDSDEVVDYPQRRYRIILRSTMGPIDVYLLSQFEEKFEEMNSVQPSMNLPISLSSGSNENVATDVITLTGLDSLPDLPILSSLSYSENAATDVIALIQPIENVATDVIALTGLDMQIVQGLGEMSHNTSRNYQDYGREGFMKILPKDVDVSLEDESSDPPKFKTTLNKECGSTEGTHSLVMRSQANESDYWLLSDADISFTHMWKTDGGLQWDGIDILDNELALVGGIGR